MSLFELPPLSLYVHIPWCVRKCPYCDFNSHVNPVNGLPEQAYLDQLKRDLVADLDFVQGRVLTSIFFGGGTPSLMSGVFYKDLLRFIEANIPFAADIEITMEANPGTTEASRFKAYYQAGINRLSVGVQSFNKEHLVVLGRIHSNDDAIKAISQAQHAGFENLNLDLMHGLPNQSSEDALADLQQAVDMGPTHISWYQLTIEQNTEYFRHQPTLPEDEALWDIQQAGSEYLRTKQFNQYEVSAFSLADRAAKHNLNYWTFGDYIGIGAGAHSKVSVPSVGLSEIEFIRYRKTRTPKDYLLPKPYFRVGQAHIQQDELGFEFLMNVLRLNRGAEETLFSARTGLTLEQLEPTLSTLRQQGLIDPTRLSTTAKGHLFLNTILEKFAS